MQPTLGDFVVFAPTLDLLCHYAYALPQVTSGLAPDNSLTAIKVIRPRGHCWAT
jgi:hypothetical protein